MIQPIAAERVILQDIEIPPEEGYILQRYDGDSGRRVVILQDIHAHRQAHRRLRKIIETLIDKGEIRLVAVEGAAGILNKGLFSFMSHPRLVASLLLEDGYLTGPEAAMVHSSSGVEFFGAETLSLYRLHLEAFLKGEALREDFHRAHLGVSQALELQKGRLLPARLVHYFDHLNKYRKGEESLKSLIAYLTSSKELAQTVRKGPHLRKFAKVLELETREDPAALTSEIEAWADHLRSSLAAADLKSFVTDLLRLRLGKLETGAVLERWLPRTAPDASGGPDFQKLRRHLKFWKASRSVRVDELDQEIDRLSLSLAEVFHLSGSSREFFELFILMDLADRLAKFQLSRGQWEEYRRYKRAGGLRRFSQMASNQCGIRNAKGVLDRLDGALEVFGKFYRLAQLRDSALARNLVRKMEFSGRKAAVLVIGGFHTAGVCSRLRSDGVSYAVVSPRIDASEAYSEVEYLRALRGGPTNLEKFFGAIPANKPASRPALDFLRPSHLAPFLRLSRRFPSQDSKTLERVVAGLAAFSPVLAGKDTAFFENEKASVKDRLLQWALREDPRRARELAEFLEGLELRDVTRDNDEIYLWVRIDGVDKVLRVFRDGGNVLDESVPRSSRRLLPPSRDAPGLEEIDADASVLERYFGSRRDESGPGEKSERNARWFEGRVFWTGIVGLIFAAGYAGLNAFSKLRDVTRNLVTSWDLAVPFIPEFVFVYLLIAPLVILPAFLVKKLNEFRLTVAAYLSVMIFSFAHYFLFPVFQPRPSPAGDSVSEQLLTLVQRFDLPYNNYPSLHVSLSVLAALILHRVHKWIGLGAAALTGMITASVLFVKQHTIADVVAGLLAGTFFYLAWFKVLPQWLGRKWAWFKEDRSRSAELSAGLDAGLDRPQRKPGLLAALRSRLPRLFLILTLFSKAAVPLTALTVSSCAGVVRSVPFSGYNTRGFPEIYNTLRTDSEWNNWVTRLSSQERQTYINLLVEAHQGLENYQRDSTDEHFRQAHRALQNFAQAGMVRHAPGISSHGLFLTLSRLDRDSLKVLLRNASVLRLIRKPSEVMDALSELGRIIQVNGGSAQLERNRFWTTLNLAVLEDSTIRDNVRRYGQEIMTVDASGIWTFPFSSDLESRLGLTEQVPDETQFRSVFSNERLCRLIAAVRAVQPSLRVQVLALDFPSMASGGTTAGNLQTIAPYITSDVDDTTWSGYTLAFWRSVFGREVQRDQILAALIADDNAARLFVLLQQTSPQMRQHLQSAFTLDTLARLSTSVNGQSFLRLARTLTFDSTGQLEVPFGIEPWREIFGRDTTPQNFLTRLENHSTDHQWLERVFRQLRGMGDENARQILRAKGTDFLRGPSPNARYLLGFATRWRGDPAALRNLAPVVWDRSYNPSPGTTDYSHALDPIMYLRIEDMGMVRRYFRVIESIDRTSGSDLRERRTRDFQVGLYILSELYRRELLPREDADDLFNTFIRVRLARRVSDPYPYRRWLVNEVIPRLRTSLDQWHAPLPPAYFGPTGDAAPQRWADVPWQDVLIRSMAGIYFQENGRLYPPSRRRVGNIIALLQHFRTDRGNGSDFLLHLSYAVELEVFPRVIRDRFPRDFPNRHEFQGRGDSWDNGHFYGSSFSISGHMSALRSEIAHAFQNQVESYERERARRESRTYEYGILSGEFEDRAIASALSRDIPYLVHGQAMEVLHLKMQLVREVLDRPASRFLVAPLLPGIVDGETEERIRRGIRLGEPASRILAGVSPSQIYYLGDALYQDGRRQFDTPSRTRLRAVDQALLDAGVDREEFLDHMNNIAGIYALSLHGVSALYDARMEPHDRYTETVSMDHEFSERLAADLVVRVMALAHEERVSPILRPYLLARATHHIYRISDKSWRSQRVPLRDLIESINRDDIRRWTQDLLREGEIERSATPLPRSPLEPLEDRYRERRRTPERRQTDEIGQLDRQPPTPLIWRQPLVLGMVVGNVGMGRRSGPFDDTRLLVERSA